MFKQLRFVAVPLMAGAIIALTTASVRAFTQQTVQPNGNYNFNYGDPDDKAKLNGSTDKSDPNSSGFQFSVEQGQTGPFGSRSFGGSSFGGSSKAGPPDYSRPLGNGD
jgi:hypothetical protein